MERTKASEEWLEFVIETLKHLDEGVQATFLQEVLLGLASLELSDEEGATHWKGVLAHQAYLVEKLGRPVTLRTAAVDYFGELRLLRNPILMEYDELRKLRHSAATDPLTGLNNRRIFDEYLVREINRTSRYGTTFALLCVDLRKFKAVNDTYGHAAGDEILRSAARAIVETIRASDISCRIGGDEFAVLLPQAGRGNSEALAERIARRFKEYAKAVAPDSPVAIDYGIAICPQDGTDATTLFVSADKTLYQRKNWAHGQPSIPFPSDEGAAQTTPEAQGAGSDAERPTRASAMAKHKGQNHGAEVEKSGRRDERVKLEGSLAVGILRVGDKSRTVKVLDLSRGGVCLLVDSPDLPDSFPARLQVPLAPDGELTLHRVYSLVLSERTRRVGCSFAPKSPVFSASSPTKSLI